MARLVLVACLLTGCLRSATVACDDQFSCPTGSTCVKHDLGDGYSCATVEQVRACDGLEDRVSCSAPGEPPRTCYGGACLPVACNDNFVDPTEACAGKPECCCGNGVLDLDAIDPREECDDGDRRNHDGCSSACTEEQPQWVERSSRPSSRKSFTLAYDLYRRRIVLFGGLSTSVPPTRLNEVWELEGLSWQLVETGAKPPPRSGHGMVYDPTRGSSLVFGGRLSNLGVANDAWSWNGAWQVVNGDQVPPSRTGMAMTFDTDRSTVVMFGGSTQSVPLNDLYEWDGETWTEHTPLNRPSPRVDAAMAYDPIRHQIVLFGGTVLNSSGLPTGSLADTWVYDGTSWSEMTVAGGPPGRAAHSMAFDPSVGRIVMMGGAGLDDVWEWGGSSWERAAQFLAYSAGRLVFDPEHGLVFVGERGGVAQLETHVRQPDGTWRQVDPLVIQPPSLVQPGIALDARRRTVVMAGGSIDAGPTNETWEWDGHWTRRANLPVALAGIQMAYDVVRDEMITFATDQSGTNAVTYRLDRSTGTWGDVPGAAPPLRTSYAMVYDEELDRVVMFGGLSSGGPLGDLWVWNGSDSTWTNVSPPPTESPSPRFNPAAVYDPIRTSVLIFGGGGAGTPPMFDLNAELWEWSLDPDGERRWHARFAAVTPPIRTGAAMAWDAARRRVVLFGGLAGQLGMDPDLLGDTWELDWVGDEPRWTPIATSITPTNRTVARMTSALDGAGVSVFGGIDGASNALGDVFTLRWDGGVHEGCGRIDGDGDGEIGCADADCWYVCTPTCAPRQPCVGLQIGCELEPVCAGPETCATCPEDCGTCTP